MGLNIVIWAFFGLEIFYWTYFDQKDFGTVLFRVDISLVVLIWVERF